MQVHVGVIGQLGNSDSLGTRLARGDEGYAGQPIPLVHASFFSCVVVPIPRGWIWVFTFSTVLFTRSALRIRRDAKSGSV